MSLYTLRRILTAAIREGAVWYMATAGERLARKHIQISPPKRSKRRTTKRKGSKRT